MALSDSDIESVREMVGGLSFATIESLCGDLNEAGEAAMQTDVETWDAKKNSYAVRMEGGSDGINFDPTRVLPKLRNRVKLRLGLAASGSFGGIFQIPVGAGYSDYC